MSKRPANDATRPKRLDEVDGFVDRLNLRLQHAEAALQAVPAKASTHVQVKPGVYAVFDRWEGGWRLGMLYGEHDMNAEYRIWDACTVEERATIATHLEKLLERLLENAARRYEAVTHAHEALDSFERRLGELKGGK